MIQEKSSSGNGTRVEMKVQNLKFSGKGYREKSQQNRHFTRVPWHPRANKKGYVKTSQLKIEKKYGRILDTKNEIVHHINGNPMDDRLSNLKIVSPEEHGSIHGGGTHKPHKKKNAYCWRKKLMKSSSGNKGRNIQLISTGTPVSK